MKHKIHRDRLMFKWITSNHEIVVGFKRVKNERCTGCGKIIPWGNNLCDDCFEKIKKFSKK